MQEHSGAELMGLRHNVEFHPVLRLLTLFLEKYESLKPTERDEIVRALRLTATTCIVTPTVPNEINITHQQFRLANRVVVDGVVLKNRDGQVTGRITPVDF